MMASITIIGLCRVSTDEQAGGQALEGLARQRTSLSSIEADLRKQNTLHVLPTVEITDVSGGDVILTPEWREQIEPALAHGSHLMVDSIDRLIRADRFNLNVLQVLQEHGSKLHIPGRTYDPNDGRDILTLTMFAGMGGYERREIMRRANAGKEEKRKRGEWVQRLASTPYGLRYDRTTKRWLHTPDAPKVLDVFRRFLAGESLSALGPVVGKSKSGIRWLLVNGLYRGILKFDKMAGGKYPQRDGRQARKKRIPRPSERVVEVRVYGGPGQEPAVVPEEVFAAVQQKLNASSGDHRRYRDKVAPKVYLSARLISAYEDGLTGYQLHQPRRHVVYGRSNDRYVCRCKDSQVRPQCALRYLRIDETNRAVDRYLSAMTTDRWGIENIQEQLRKLESDVEDHVDRKKRLQDQVRDIERKLETLTDLLLDRRISREKHDVRQDALKGDLDAVKRQLGTVMEPPRVDMNSIKTAWGYCTKWSHEKKREWISRWCAEIRVDNDGIEGVGVRVPGLNGRTVLCVPMEGRLWKTLLGYDPWDEFARLSASDVVTQGWIIRQLGWPASEQSRNRIAYLMSRGLIPTPTARRGHKWVMSVTEGDGMVQAIKVAAAKQWP